jgi:hypothetical protein
MNLEFLLSEIELITAYFGRLMLLFINYYYGYLLPDGSKN